MAMSKRCIPYTPRTRELKQSVFALVTTTGVHLRSQEPYVEDDNTWRLIPGDVQTADLMITHDHYDHHGQHEKHHDAGHGQQTTRGCRPREIILE